ncbi:MAG: phosphate signaling complex protein PhoU [Phenylobacterium sp.]|uniref:phosphate signaling complex protein PhoU n=1 Tax=Phenylobacterium sp. TaxID=1871053 RepID=UPI001A4A39D0|nr:phosphate signaling complex protein PhoU [Phenylobacterium sp.]MBL8772259.1 phosphate signaling complex protein PhoU [Phenylobacterium sp.]
MEHTLRAVDSDLGAMTHGIAAMGDLAVSQVRAALDVFVRRDLDLAGKVVRGDDALDIQDAEIEKRAIRFIALRQPMADDLRRPIAAMKIAMQLERVGDLGKNIAKRVLRMEASPPPGLVASIVGLGELSAERLAAVVDAFRAGDAQGAYSVWLKDTDIDERHERVLADLIQGMSAGGQSAGDWAHLLFIAKNLERIGDHATNIAELVHYQITGRELEDRPKL